jgi:hypothetical protein
MREGDGKTLKSQLLGFLFLIFCSGGDYENLPRLAVRVGEVKTYSVLRELSFTVLSTE